MSSAKRATDVEDATSGRSFTYTRNKSGPSIDPCGTPDKTQREMRVEPGNGDPLDAVSKIVFEPRQQGTVDAESVDLLEK